MTIVKLYDEDITKSEADVMSELIDDGQKYIEEKLGDETSRIGLGGKVSERARKLLTGFVKEVRPNYINDPSIEWPKGKIDELAERIFRVIYGLGPFEALLEQDGIEDVAINGASEVAVRTSEGWTMLPKEELVDISKNPKALQNIFNRAIEVSGQSAGPMRPIIDDQLPGSGHRISIITEPVAADYWPLIVIRRHRPVKFTMGDYLETPVSGYTREPVEIPEYLTGWTPDALLSPSAATLLDMSVKAGLNIILIGKTGVGKTSFLSMLGSLIPLDRRVLVLEDTRELQLRDGRDPQNCVYVTSVSKRLEGGIEIPMSLLVKAALRQRPDALIMGEARGAEMWDLIQAMQTGHGGMLTSVHAINSEELVSRVEYMISLADIKRDQKAIANLISTSFQIAITLLMDHSGRRYVENISAFTGRLPEDDIGDRPNLETLFEGGPKNNFELKLVKKNTALEDKFSRVGLSFENVVGVAKQEKEILAEK